MQPPSNFLCDLAQPQIAAKIEQSVPFIRFGDCFGTMHPVVYDSIQIFGILRKAGFGCYVFAPRSVVFIRQVGRRVLSRCGRRRCRTMRWRARWCSDSWARTRQGLQKLHLQLSRKFGMRYTLIWFCLLFSSVCYKTKSSRTSIDKTFWFPI